MNHKNASFSITRWALLLLIASPLACAEPVGEMLPFTEMGEAMLVMSGGTLEEIEASIPTREAVGLPVYPGAYFTATMEGSGMLPSVIMASADPIDEVKAWYAAQEGLTWDDMFELFYVGDSYQMMQTASVLLQDISADPSVSTGGMGGFDMSGMKTQITISYEP